jgi:hypothetical protein
MLSKVRRTRNSHTWSLGDVRSWPGAEIVAEHRREPRARMATTNFTSAVPPVGDVSVDGQNGRKRPPAEDEAAQSHRLFVGQAANSCLAFATNLSSASMLPVDAARRKALLKLRSPPSVHCMRLSQCATSSATFWVAGEGRDALDFLPVSPARCSRFRIPTVHKSRSMTTFAAGRR